MLCLWGLYSNFFQFSAIWCLKNIANIFSSGIKLSYYTYVNHRYINIYLVDQEVRFTYMNFWSTDNKMNICRVIRNKCSIIGRDIMNMQLNNNSIETRGRICKQSHWRTSCSPDRFPNDFYIMALYGNLITWLYLSWTW